ncbi:hypothetical protein ILYODFUR_037284 [Ilyodon furcidens]|uniref:Uncharacterized protein n=1 Tax=Ilyodon furcidens TaxID=33524 RepID=A0ABV0U232_9TELE
MPPRYSSDIDLKRERRPTPVKLLEKNKNIQNGATYRINSPRMAPTVKNLPPTSIPPTRGGSSGNAHCMADPTAVPYIGDAGPCSGQTQSCRGPGLGCRIRPPRSGPRFEGPDTLTIGI